MPQSYFGTNWGALINSGSGASSYGVANTNTGTFGGFSGNVGGAGMSSAMAGGIASGVGSLISGYFSSQSQARQQAASAKMQRDNNLADAYRQDKQYKWALEDRLASEKGWDQYRDKYKGNMPVMAVEFTDPNTVQLVDPFKKK